MDYYNLKMLDKIVDDVLSREDLFIKKNRVEILNMILNEIKSYRCFVDNCGNCPYSFVHASMLQEKKSIKCSYLNKNAYAFVGEEVRLLECPYEQYEKKILLEIDMINRKDKLELLECDKKQGLKLVKRGYKNDKGK